MYPEIFKLGPVAIRSYGVMLAFSFLLGILYVRHMSKNKSIDFDRLLTVAYILIIGAIIGARLSYVLFHLEEFSGNYLNAFNPFGSDQIGIAGLNLYGGIIGAIICSFIYIRAKKMSVLETFDIFAPTIGVGLAFTRIGCFLNGCCFGTPTNLPWGVTFPEGSIPYYVFGSTALHPSQIYSSIYGIILFIILHQTLKHKRFRGEVVGLLFMIEAVFRFAIEYVRYYEDAMHIHFLGMNPTYNHLISISLFALGLVIYLVQLQMHKSVYTEPNYDESTEDR
ncbi:MAG: prolipoprotein diacylglyceryl transferase [Candidatus Zixiibacteriota bacterium]